MGLLVTAHTVENGVTVPLLRSNGRPRHQQPDAVRRGSEGVPLPTWGLYLTPVWGSNP
jgi:hypothetical protein